MPTSRPPPLHQPSAVELRRRVLAERLHLLRARLLVGQERARSRARRRAAASRSRPACGPRSGAPGCCRRRCRARSRPRSWSSWRSRASRSGPPPRPMITRAWRPVVRSMSASSSLAVRGVADGAGGERLDLVHAGGPAEGAIDGRGVQRELHAVGTQLARLVAVVGSVAHPGADAHRLADLVHEAPPGRAGLVAEHHQAPRVRAHVDDGNPLHEPGMMHRNPKFPGRACRWWSCERHRTGIRCPSHGSQARQPPRPGGDRGPADRRRRRAGRAVRRRRRRRATARARSSR